VSQFFYNAVANPKVYRAALINADFEKLDLFGADYIMHCIEETAQKTIYRKYIADSMANITEAIFATRGSKANVPRYVDIYEPQKPVDTRTADDIVEEVNRKCGLTMIDTEEGEM
jgi:hypothetical protein